MSPLIDMFKHMHALKASNEANKRKKIQVIQPRVYEHLTNTLVEHPNPDLVPVCSNILCYSGKAFH